MRAERSRWVVGGSHAAEADRVLALNLDDVASAERNGAEPTLIHLALDGEVPPATSVLVDVPRWRGHSFIALLEWLVCAKLAAPSAEVTWMAEAKGGATGLRRTLDRRGWSVAERKAGRRRVFTGTAPAPASRPHPETFEAELGGARLTFASDWGVFSEGEIDDGTKLLFDVAVDAGPIDAVLDVGTGYGPLAVGLVASGTASRAIVTEVDSVALILASINASAAGVPLRSTLTNDPTSVKRAPLVVCNFPTHADRESSNDLVARLASIAAGSTVLVVVHASLEERFTHAFGAVGASVAVAARATHAVLALSR